jgi:5-methylthioribose kinase
MQAILDYQHKSFLDGDQNTLKPMVLKDIAEKTGFDISTISRVVNSKYIETHFGIYSLKYFFSEGLENQDGEEVSTRELKKALQEDGEFIAENFLLRHKFMSCPETLVHADTHTSNIFLDEEVIKVIDMEYTFGGPFSYDLGYFINSLITQFCAACFRPFPREEDRRTYQTYILTQIIETYEYFVCYFKDFWDKDAKEVYRSCPAWRDKFIESLLPDILGFACIPTFAVVLAPGDGWMDIAVIPDAKDRLNAKYMLVVLCRHLLVNRHKYTTIQEAVEEIVHICDDFLRKL